jgi:hypothetical protein
MKLRQLTLAAPLALGLGWQPASATDVQVGVPGGSSLSAGGSSYGAAPMKHVDDKQDEALHGNAAGGAGETTSQDVQIGVAGGSSLSAGGSSYGAVPMKHGNDTASASSGQTSSDSTTEVAADVQVGVAGGSSVSAGGSSYGSTPMRHLDTAAAPARSTGSGQ